MLSTSTIVSITSKGLLNIFQEAETSNCCWISVGNPSHLKVLPSCYKHLQPPKSFQPLMTLCWKFSQLPRSGQSPVNILWDSLQPSTILPTLLRSVWEIPPTIWNGSKPRYIPVGHSSNLESWKPTSNIRWKSLQPPTSLQPLRNLLGAIVKCSFLHHFTV